MLTWNGNSSLFRVNVRSRQIGWENWAIGPTIGSVQFRPKPFIIGFLFWHCIRSQAWIWFNWYDIFDDDGIHQQHERVSHGPMHERLGAPINISLITKMRIEAHTFGRQIQCLVYDAFQCGAYGRECIRNGFGGVQCCTHHNSKHTYKVKQFCAYWPNDIFI